MTDRLKNNALVHALLLCAFTAEHLGEWHRLLPSFEADGRRMPARAADGVTVLFNALEEDLREFAVDKNFLLPDGYCNT
jgi:hypothetical protein